MVDLQRVRELAELMEEHGLNVIRIREGGTVIDLRKGVPAPAQPVAQLPAAVPTASTPATGQAQTETDEALSPVRSPMVGSFYLSSDPESPPFVSIGAEVEPDTTVCIIEAMKVFNEIKADVAGTVERILVQNEQAVEFGQPLMLVRTRSQGS